MNRGRLGEEIRGKETDRYLLTSASSSLMTTSLVIQLASQNPLGL
jgi:hypothetical protein